MKYSFYIYCTEIDHINPLMIMNRRSPIINCPDLIMDKMFVVLFFFSSFVIRVFIDLLLHDSSKVSSPY